jgi:hypothetical protein
VIVAGAIVAWNIPGRSGGPSPSNPRSLFWKWTAWSTIPQMNSPSSSWCTASEEEAGSAARESLTRFGTERRRRAPKRVTLQRSGVRWPGTVSERPGSIQAIEEVTGRFSSVRRLE